MSEPKHAVIAGAGVGGLTAAVAFARLGWRVTLLERAPVIEEAGAGLQLAPNATRALRDLGLLDAVARAGLAPEQARIRRYRDGSDIANVPLGPLAELRWRAPSLVIHRADLQHVLMERLAAEPLVQITTGATVAGFAADGDRIEIGAKIGDAPLRVDADVLIGADGLRSVLRERLGLGLADQPVWSGRVAWRALTPVALAPDFARRLETGLWLGPRAHLVHYPLRHCELINIVAITEDHWRAGDAPDLWSIPGNAAEVGKRFSNWHADARALIASAPAWRRWPLFDRAPARRWRLPRVALLGDAAHPMLPFLAQGAAQAIEDANALGRAFAGQPDNVDAALAAYEGARAARAAAVVLASRRQGAIYHMAGPLAVARNFTMRQLGASGMMARLDWLYGPDAA